MIAVKTTNNLSNDEKLQLVNLFNRTFNKDFNLEDFFKKFSKNIKGYSYHSILFENNNIIGCYSVIPFLYSYHNKKLIFGLSVDTMIKEENRGNPFVLKKLASNMYDYLKKENIPFVFGFPNDNVYLIRKKILKWRDIGQLKYYILPINLKAVKKRLDIFSPLYKAFILPLINSCVKTSFEKFDDNEKEIFLLKNNDFINSRFDQTYNIKKNEFGYFSYKIYFESELKVAYLIDVYPLTKENIESSVKYIYQNYKSEIDIIMYIGILNFKLKNLFEVPKKFEPKSVYMSGMILIEELLDTSIFNIDNWCVNLSNFDVR